MDLFSGIGGFSLGLESTGGFETVAFCDNEPFAQAVLKKHWPHVPIYEDVRDVGVDTVGLDRVDVITGGFPCQSVSVAGLQKATEDDRWLWPEMFRIIKEIHPKYVIGENVRNLVGIRDGVVFEQVCTDLESEGYETKTLILPASSQNAPHLRYRCFIIAILGNSEHDGQFAKSQLRSDDETSNECKEKQKATREFEGASRPSDGAGISGSECKSEQSAVQKENRTRSDVADTKSGMRRGGRAISESRENKKWGLHSKKEKQTSNDLRSKTVGCNPMGRETKDLSTSNDNGQQRGCIETRYEITTGENAQSIRRTSTKDFGGSDNDGRNRKEPISDGSLQGSRDDNKTRAATATEVREISEGKHNDQGTGTEDGYQEDNDRALVSQGSKRVQPSIDRGLEQNQTLSEDNKVRQRDDKGGDSRMDTKDVADTESGNVETGCERSGAIRTESEGKRASGDATCGSKVSTANVADTKSEGLERYRQHSKLEREQKKEQFAKKSQQDVSDSISQRGRSRKSGGKDAEDARELSRSEEHWQGNTGGKLGRTGDGVSKRIHGHWGDNWEEGTPRVAEGQKNRTQRLKALGNSVIPQIPAVLGRAILQIEMEKKK